MSAHAAPSDPARHRPAHALRALLWLWVAGVTAAYLTQFRALLVAILDQYL